MNDQLDIEAHNSAVHN